MKGRNRGFTEYQRTLFNKYDVDEGYLQTRKQRRACLELLEKVDKNQVSDEKKLIGKIAAAFEGTSLYRKIASCVTIAALLVTLQGTPVMAGAVSLRQNAVVTAMMTDEITDNSVVMDDDSFITGYAQTPQKTKSSAVQPAKGSDNVSSSGILLASSVLLDDDSDAIALQSFSGPGIQSESDQVTVTFENHDKIEKIYQYYYYGYYNTMIKYDIDGYGLIVNGLFGGVDWTTTAGDPSDTVVQSVYDNFTHYIGFYDYDFFDIESISITNNSDLGLTFSFSGYKHEQMSFVSLESHEIESGAEKTIIFSSEAADSINILLIHSYGDYGNYASRISIDDITLSNITPLTPVVIDNTKYGTEDTVMNFTVSDFVYNSSIGEPLSGIQIVLPPDPSHGVLRMDNTILAADDNVDAADLDKITFTPAPGFVGNTSFTYKGYDGSGYSKKPATMILSIASPNTPPVAIDNNTWSTYQNQPVQNGNLTGDVTDADEGDTFTYELVTGAAHGNVVVNPNGTFIYTPDTNFHGTDSFTWRVSDGTAWSNTATVTITVREAVNDDTDYDEDEEDDDTPAPTPKPTPVPVPKGIVMVDGIEYELGTEIVTNEEGIKTAEFSVDNEMLEEIINQAIAAGQATDPGTTSTVEFYVKTTDANHVTVSLNAALIQKLNDNGFALFVNTNGADYLVPADAIRIAEIVKAMGFDLEHLKDITIEISIETPDDEALREITANAEANGYEIVFPPVRFTVTAKAKAADGSEKTVIISEFSRYVERIMPIPEGVDPAEITTGVVYNGDGTFSHVPTEVFEKDGVYYARIRSMSNSTYLVIYNSVTVPSVKNHWSGEIVNDLASRLVIAKPESFLPDREITRGEFAEYIAKAIGIYRTRSEKTIPFSDVDTEDELADAIVSAAEYGIIKGFTDGTFRPDLKISREEAMAMYARAMDIIDLEDTGIDKLESYSDADQIAEWAYEYVKKVTGAGIFVGRTMDTIDPKGTFTCAEAATAISNLLKAAGLINP